MRLKEYLDLQTQERRILIVSDAAKAGQLFRRYEGTYHRMVGNVYPLTVKNAAEQVFHHIQAEQGPVPEYRLLSSTEAMMVFRSVLQQNTRSLRYFTDARMFNLQTSVEIFRKADLIRMNGRLEGADQLPNFQDLILLNALYDQELEQRRMLDDTALYRYVLDRTDEHTKELFGSSYGILQEDTDRLSGIQLAFLKKCFGEVLEPVEVFEEDKAEIKDAAVLRNARFFKGYGPYNEAAYIAWDIAAHSLPLGQVLVLHTAESQIQPLQAALDANGLHAAYLSPHIVRNNPYITLMRNLLQWATTDYPEAMLERILSNPVLVIRAVNETGETFNPVGDSRYFDYVIDAGNRYHAEDKMLLGWGYERNARFIQHESAEKYEQIPEILAFHGDLLKVFGDGEHQYTEVCPSTVWNAMISFVKKYTERKPERTAVLSTLEDTGKAIALEERVLPFAEAAALLGEMLETITVSAKEQPGAIAVRRLSDWTVIDRPYVYVIGLSLKDMQGNTNESPAIRDDDINRFIGEGWKPTVQAEAEYRERNLYRTLKLYNGKQISFGYSFFDTINIRESGPSSFYRTLQQTAGTKNEQTFVYGNPVGENAILKEPPELYRSFVLPEKTSYSSLSVLLECPRRYYYQRVRDIPENEYIANDPEHWLLPNDTGNFFHAVAEEYVNRGMNASGGNYSNFADRVLLKELFEEQKKIYIVTSPADSYGLIEQETDELLADTVQYFDGLHEALSGKDRGWRILYAEKHFRKAPWTIEYDEGKQHTFLFSGTIDRIDYRVDDDSHAVRLRIVDYKTGSVRNKQEEDSSAVLLQHAIYYHALMDNLAETSEGEKLLDHIRNEVSEREGRDLRGWNWLFDRFQYDFPRDKDPRYPEKNYSITRENLEGQNIIRLKMTMKAAETAGYYPDVPELYRLCSGIFEGDPATEEILGILEKAAEHALKDSGPCRFCSYRRLCSRKGTDEDGQH